MNSFERLIDKLIAEDRFRNATEIADAIGITISAFLRGTKDGGLGVEACLRLAKAASLQPSDVLRAAGKGDVADLIEELYLGDDAPKPTTATDRALLALPDHSKRAVLQFARTFPPRP